MAWGKYQKRPKILPKCAEGCWPHETGTMIYSATFTGMVYYCRVADKLDSDGRFVALNDAVEVVGYLRQFAARLAQEAGMTRVDRAVDALRRLEVSGCDVDALAPIETEAVRELFSALAAETGCTSDAPEAGTCETCQFAGPPNRPPAYGRTCFAPWSEESDPSNVDVPLTINGQPFGCRGWQAKPAPPDGDRAKERP